MQQDNQNYPPIPEEKQEGLGAPLTILSFCFPIAGAIIYFIHNGKNKEKANTACYAALAGLGLGILIRVLTMAMVNQ